jgi:hypothetical protein
MGTKTIRLNPSWEWAARVFVEALEHGDEPAQREAKREIIKMAKGFDELLRKHTDYFEPKEVTLNERK